MSDKTKAVAKELIPALEAAGFTVEAHEQSWRTRYNIHHLDKHIGTVDVSQKYTFDPVNIRVEAAGWEPTDRYNLRNWQKNPYSHYRWVGRNYRKIDSVVKALVASLETIPGDEERVYAKAVEKATSIYNDRHRVDSGLRDINIDLLRYLIKTAEPFSIGKFSTQIDFIKERLAKLDELNKQYDEAVQTYRDLDPETGS